MARAQTTDAKYVFLDVVGFTANRPVEAQTDIVEAMNAAVAEALEATSLTDEALLKIPTGDGLCVAMLDVGPYDVHLQLAREVLSRVKAHNEKTWDPTRRFEVRIGVNENIDNIITDINESKNVAGAGINIAQRVMSLADGSQILVSQSVFDVLSPREGYSGSFQEYSAEVQHEETLTVHQYVPTSDSVVNTSVPSAFYPEEEPPEEKPGITHRGLQPVRRDEMVQKERGFIRNIKREAIMFGKDMSWANDYEEDIRRATNKGRTIRVFYPESEAQEVRRNARTLREAGAELFPTTIDSELLALLVDPEDPNEAVLYFVRSYPRSGAVQVQEGAPGSESDHEYFERIYRMDEDWITVRAARKIYELLSRGTQREDQ